LIGGDGQGAHGRDPLLRKRGVGGAVAPPYRSGGEQGTPHGGTPSTRVRDKIRFVGARA